MSWAGVTSLMVVVSRAMEPFGGVAAVADLPRVVGLDEHRLGQPEQGLGVGEYPHDVGAAVDLLVEPLQGVGGPDLLPMAGRERGEGQQVLAVGGVISSYYSSNPQPRIPYWELGFADITLRLLGSDDFHPQVKAQAASALTKALVEGDLRIPIRGAPPARGDRAGAPTGRAGHPRPSRTSL
jgi:hypothetical protein